MTDSEFKKEIAISLRRISFAFQDMCVLFYVIIGLSLAYTLWKFLWG